MLPLDGKPIPGEEKIETGRAFAEGAGGLLSIAMLAGLVWLWIATYHALLGILYGQPVYLVVFVAMGLAALGAVFYVFRDLRKLRTVAALQVAIAVAAGTVSIFGAETLALKALAALAAMVVTANGVSKLRGY
jgi:hypothetical protein